MTGGASCPTLSRVTLASLLVSLSVLGLVMATNFSVLSEGRAAYESGAARVEAQQAARIALGRMSREIRTAGSGKAGVFFPAISVAEPARIVLHRDLNADGIVDGIRETVTWKLDGTILRRDAGGGAQPIVNGVRALSFTYLDEDGAVTTAPERVRNVKITLTTGAALGSRVGTGTTTTVATQVRLRNR